MRVFYYCTGHEGKIGRKDRNPRNIVTESLSGLSWKGSVKINFNSSVMGRDWTHQIRWLRAPSNPALSISSFQPIPSVSQNPLESFFLTCKVMSQLGLMSQRHTRGTGQKETRLKLTREQLWTLTMDCCKWRSLKILIYFQRTNTRNLQETRYSEFY